jgi:glutamate carboxypeptidase
MEVPPRSREVPAIRERVKSLGGEMLRFLEKLVEINSHLTNPQGIKSAGRLATRAMPRSLSHRVITGYDGLEHHLFANGAASGDPVLMVGHLDTVFDPEDAFQRFEDRGEKLHGPGTADMKGGVTVMIFALRVLEDLGLLKGVPVTCLLNGDEENGSPFSSVLLKELAGRSRAGLVFECGGPGGEVVTARRGIRQFTLRVTGESGHSGVRQGPKASAILDLSRRVTALEGLNDPTKGLSVNVGRISGGSASNVIPGEAKAEFEMRFWDEEGNREGQALVRRASLAPSPEGCIPELQDAGRRPPMSPLPQTGELLSILKRAADELGFRIGAERRGGGSDANWLASEGLPCLDGLGPIGDNDHSPGEYILRESLFHRVELTSLFLLRLGAP